MIYLIDDKTNRQKDFGWNKNKINLYRDILVSFSDYDQIKNSDKRELIFNGENVILFHESFFENIDYKHKKDGNEIKNDLAKFSVENKNLKIVFFSGSYNSREINETGGSIPVSILYQNLECFLNNYKIGTFNLNYLFFGENLGIESEIIKKNEHFNSLLISELNDGNISCDENNIIVTGNRLGFSNPFNNISSQTIFNKNVNDKDINSKILEWFSSIEYNIIFIPLCFGPTLSDYNGLRLATHIRCTPTKNQLRPIYIYGFVDYTFLIENEYFDILKTKNVFLIGYSKKSFEGVLNNEISDLTIDLLPQEIKKINLKIPSNYEDNHSVANEWAIYRWSQVVGAKDENIEKIIEIQNSNLYFKYLKTIYPVTSSDTLENEKLKINHDGSPRIFYIDDEAEKGWREIFETIFYDKNENIDFSYLDTELNNKTKDEICHLVLNAVKEDDIDLVILDFRLHKEDFENNEIEDITGYQILKKIKEHNPGIQVIIFSATNKIWNLQALQKEGADGFVIKESPEKSVDNNFTKKSILNLVEIIENRIGMIFLKKVSSLNNDIKSILTQVSDSGEKNNSLDEGLMKMKFKNEIFIQLDIIYDCLKKSSERISTFIEDEHSYLNLSFISIFKIIEIVNDFYTDNTGTRLKSNSTKVQTYDQNSDSFVECSNQYPSTRDKIYTIIKHELNDEPRKYVSQLNRFISYRNNIVHPKTLKEYKKTSKEDNVDFIKIIYQILLNIK